MTTTSAFASRYGPWALVAGASEGLGAAFATSLARRGLNLVLWARRGEVLLALAAQLRGDHGVDVEVAVVDLADGAATAAATAALVERRAVGLVVFNAAFAPVGAFAERDIDQLLRVVDVNVRAPLVVVRALLPAMVARRQGGVVLMSSMAGQQGSARIAAYSATKAFATTLGEALWAELKPHNVDVVACVAGAIRTPGFERSATKDAPGMVEADVVVAAALDGLGGSAVVIPGGVNRIASFVMRRLLPRAWALRIMEQNTRSLT